MTRSTTPRRRPRRGRTASPSSNNRRSSKSPSSSGGRRSTTKTTTNTETLKTPTTETTTRKSPHQDEKEEPDDTETMEMIPTKSYSFDYVLLIVFCTHGLLNTLLVSFVNPLRGWYWNLTTLTSDQSYVLNWYSWAHWQLFGYITCLVGTCHAQHVIQQQRCVMAMIVIVTSYIVNGMSMIPMVHLPMALVQGIILMGLLVAVMVHHARMTNTTALLSTTSSAFGLLTKQSVDFRASSFDARRKLPIPTLALLVQALWSMVHVIHMVVWSHESYYMSNGNHVSSSSDVVKTIVSAIQTDVFLSALVLLSSVFLATVPQQRLLLAFQAVCLFLSLVLLTTTTTTTNDDDEHNQSKLKAAGTGHLIRIIIAVLGAL